MPTSAIFSPRVACRGNLLRGLGDWDGLFDLALPPPRHRSGARAIVCAAGDGAGRRGAALCELSAAADRDVLLTFRLPSKRGLSKLGGRARVVGAAPRWRSQVPDGHSSSPGRFAMAAVDSVRNVAIVGPNGTGKTTLLESLLFVAGATARKGKISEGNTVGDASPEARERQMSTEVNAATIEHEGLVVSVLDCPGTVDFAQEVHNVLLGVDAAVVVVEPVLERMITVSPLLKFLDAHQIPHLIFINKMDRSEVAYRDLLQSLRDLSDRPVGAASVRDRPRRQPGRLHRSRDRAGLQLQRRRALGADRSAGRVSGARAGGAHRDARDARRLRRRPDGDAARGAGAAGRGHPAPHAKDARRRSDRAGVHGRRRARDGGAAPARGADQGDPAVVGGRGAGRDRSVRRHPGPGAQELPSAARRQAVPRAGSGPARSRTA